MIEIIKVFKESLPAIRLIGKRHTDDDRDNQGSFAGKWGEWFEKGYFEILKELGPLSESESATYGCMSCIDGEFAYWIGMFFPADTSVPENLDYVDLPAGNVGTCWIYGKQDSREFFGDIPHRMCYEKINENGWSVKNNFGDGSETYWFFEKYNCPRFTTPDEKGNVILDYSFYINE